MNEPIAAHTPGARWSRGLPGTERSLARRASDGDPKAFETIFKRHAQELYRYCLAILRRPEDAQDALQSTMANALRSLPGEKREITLRPWLFRVAHNEAITVLRQRRTTIDPDEVVEQTSPGADATASDRERLRTLVADLGSLPEQQRSALVMQELNGMSHDEVASALEISPGAARQAVYEARSALTQIGEGRSMGCESVRQKISARDGRLLRGRKVRAHLRACERCQDFAAAIDQRRTDFAALFPPMPAAAAASVFATVTGGTLSGGGGAVAGTAGAGGLSAISAKGAAVVAATAALGVGAAGYSGAVDIPLPGAGDGDDTSKSAGSQAGGSENSAGHRQDAGRADAGRGNSQAAGHDQSHGEKNGHGNDHGNAGGNGGGNGGGGNSNAGGNADVGAYSYTPGVGGATPPGQGGTPPGQAFTPPSQGSPPPSSNAGSGGQATAPGQTTSPGQSAGHGPG